MTGTSPTDFCIHEINFKPHLQTPFGPLRNEDVSLALRSPVFKEGKAKGEAGFIPFNQRCWKIVQRNQAEPTRLETANNRIIHQTVLNGDAISFMTALGYEYWFEFVIMGYLYHLGTIEISIFRVYELEVTHRVSSARLRGEKTVWMVEMRDTCGAERVEGRSKELFRLKGLVGEIVEMGVVSHTILQTKLKYT